MLHAEDTFTLSVFPATFMSFANPRLCKGGEEAESIVKTNDLLQHFHPGLSAHLNRVPGTAQRRSIAEIEIIQPLDSHVVEQGGGKDVDPLRDL